MDAQRLRDLVDAYIDHTLSAGQKSELERALIASAEVRRAFWEHVQIHADLRDLLLEADGGQVFKEPSRGADAEGTEARRERPAKAKPAKRIPTPLKSPDVGPERRRNPVPRPAWTRWLAVAACLALVVGAIWLIQQDAGATPARLGLRLVDLQGEAGVIRAGRTLPATLGLELCEGDQVQTRAGGNVMLAYADEATRFGLGTATCATFRAVEGAKRVHLAIGLLDCTVAPQRKSVEIETPHAVATVIGTQFRLAVSTTVTSLAVREGTVAMRQGGTQLAVGVAQAAEARNGELKLTSAGNPVARVDGRILFQDSFKNGFANWHLYLIKADGMQQPTTEAACPDIRIVETPREGKGIRAAALTGTAPKGQRVGIINKDVGVSGRLDGFSLSYEYTFDGRPRLAMEGIEIYQDSAPLANGPTWPRAMPPGSWNAVRWEMAWTGKQDAHGRLLYDARLFFNGEFLGQRLEAYDNKIDPHLMLEVIEGRFRFANVAICELRRD